MSMNSNVNESELIKTLISPERLAALEKLTGSLESAIKIHQETLRLGSLLLNVIATLEIAIRNSVSCNLVTHFALHDWLSRPPVNFKWRKPETEKIEQAVRSARRAQYAKLSQAEKAALDKIVWPNGRPANISHAKRSSLRQKHINVTEGKIIAELTFYFWKRLFGPEYEHNLWKPSLRMIFPDRRIRRATVAVHLENIYQARNRLAHHEPVLHGRFKDAKDGIIFISQHLGAYPPSPNTPLAMLITYELAEVLKAADELHARLEEFRGA